MEKAAVAVALRGARQAAALTQGELAEAMGTTQSAVSRAESGFVQPSLDFLERFVRETGATLRLGSLLLVPLGEVGVSREERAARVRRVTGGRVADPWARDPSSAERKSLESDGLTREHFESARTPRARRD